MNLTGGIGIIKKYIIKIFWYAIGLTSTLLMFIILVTSLFNNYQVTIFSNLYGECWIEIILILVMLPCLLYIMYHEFKKIEGEKV